MALMGGRKVGGHGVGLVREEEGLERRERGVEPWRKWVVVVVVGVVEEESLRERSGGRWRSEAARDIFFWEFWILGSGKEMIKDEVFFYFLFFYFG